MTLLTHTLISLNLKTRRHQRATLTRVQALPTTLRQLNVAALEVPEDTHMQAQLPPEAVQADIPTRQ